MKDPDITKLPVITCWPKDGGPFVTLPIIHTKDPNTQTRNVGMYRMQVFGPVLTGMHWHKHKVSAKHFSEYKKLGVKPLLIMVVMVALLIVFTDQTANLFKHGFQRSRPCRAEGVMEHMRFIAERCGLYGFFSGHAANSMGVAVFAGLILKPYYKNLIFILLFWSFVVSYSRIYVGVHYPLDIVCGLVFGALAGFMFYNLSMYLMKRCILQ
jgi:undecaprenyl-diphosphatase